MISRRTYSALFVALSLCIAPFPASVFADQLDEATEICQRWLQTDMEDSELGDACFSALKDLEGGLPLREPTVAQQRPPAPELIVADSIIHDGHRDSILQRLRLGESVEIIVEFEVREVLLESHGRAIEKGLVSLGEEELAYKRKEFARVKESGLLGLSGVTLLEDFENLPMAFVRVSTEADLDELLARPEVRVVFENTEIRPTLVESLLQIGQPTADAAGFGGAGTTVAVFDTGVDYTAAPFNCVLPGEVCRNECDLFGENCEVECDVHGGDCRIRATLEASTSNDGNLDDPASLHGSHVSAIIAATASDADLVVADIFDSYDTSVAGAARAVLAATDWVIANKSTYNIVAVNSSFGILNAWETEPCPNSEFAAAIGMLVAAGIQPINSTGNRGVVFGSFNDGVNNPSCVPGVVRVGAVYDHVSATGVHPFCTDPLVSADSVTCFSQTAPILSILAPGAGITAGPFISNPPFAPYQLTYSGTSQAAPHVAGAWAVLRAAAPESIGNSLILAAMQDTGVAVTDFRIGGPGRTTPRLNLAPEADFGTLALCGVLALVGCARRRYAQRE